MTAYDKSDQIGYDELDKKLNKELEDMVARTPPNVVRNLQQRIHDGILHRMKEETTRRCFPLLEKYQECANTMPPHRVKECYPHRDAINFCAQEVNREETYQKYRIMYLHGELLKYHEQKLAAKMEAFKAQAPDAIRDWKADYAPKYAEMMEDIGLNPAKK
ncbi:hypothetical protein STCU_01957 [Strigomonas culicis]|uniref:COX assembly mitochondrial protein n=2 Tax=Strigomonas culicis TaxID=28005 RepID=S9UK11_9TRYP|nr:hypothetical protein STCU_03599 [Strigomonas culicis]EPY33809.1 hypothetical protein STCU_01957 [Strigomonas culicis]|eukprot:EPY31147.1 hypothetical protein STCU_03599 [Strigomonas culicis]